MGNERFAGETIVTCPGCGYSVGLVRIVGAEIPKDVICPECGNFFLKKSSLTRCEAQVVRELAGGSSTSEAAKKLGVSNKTIECHRLSIYRKIGIRDLSSLTKYALEHGLTTMKMRVRRGNT